MSSITKSRRLAWVAAVRRPNITFDSIPVSMRVCSRHFHSGKPVDAMYTSHPDWAPSLHLGHTETKATETARFERQQARKRRRTETTSAVDDTVMPETTIDTPAEDSQHEAEPGPETECDLCQKRRDEINRLLEENRALKLELGQKKMDEDSLKGDNVRLRYYTGLPSAKIFMSLLATLLPLMTRSSRVLSPFQMLILTLMRLRLNLPMQHLAYVFSVDRTTISRTFNSMVELLYCTITPLIVWPSREALYTTMPHQFVEAFGNRVAVIVDCFEIFIERPSNLTTQAQAYSNYKHNTTMKYLIGITPYGTISFISKGWGGRISDKHVTENCGILDRLLPRDVVLADRGFDISESVGLMCAEVKIPAFTRGHCQLEARDVESTRKLAHLRIHVERVIGVVRNKYTLLSAKLPISIVLPCDGEDVTFLDKIVSVCCSLTNMSKSVV
ncbi:uncharacterized protein LOC134458738 isoform X1 [Engraulis encrasicolus]|uniref:uncharacterized protein LOC134458738 isoform X1 n=2 Tax=Engraulis encrasicolus TaxID=184585 RepID=UPI002FD1E80B